MILGPQRVSECGTLPGRQFITLRLVSGKGVGSQSSRDSLDLAEADVFELDPHRPAGVQLKGEDTFC